MFKIFLTRNEMTQLGSQTYSASLGMNGEDMFNIMPPEVQDTLLELMNEDPDVKDYFKNNNLIYLVAKKVTDITNKNEDEKRHELAEISESNFFE